MQTTQQIEAAIAERKRQQWNTYQRDYRARNHDMINAKQREYRRRKKAEKSRREAATSSAAKNKILHCDYSRCMEENQV